jgi:hypothetical protein
LGLWWVLVTQTDEIDGFRFRGWLGLGRRRLTGNIEDVHFDWFPGLFFDLR